MSLSNPNDLAILACYAHPDDEQGVTGTLRRCLDSGIRAAILCATRGEVGQIADPSLATPETLGQVREDELRRAAAVVGISQVYFLDYRDSGMDGSAENRDSRAFINADPHEAVGHIVRVIREFRPTILVTFDETGGYGHPDHLAIHRWTTQAFHVAGDASQYPEAGPAFAPARLYYAGVTRSAIRLLQGFLKEVDADSIFGQLDPDKFGIPDEALTHSVDVRPYVRLKRDSLAEHKTQIAPNSIFTRVPEEMWDMWRSVEPFALVAGQPLPPGYDREDLFAGLR